MDAFMLLLGWLGIYCPVALAAIGSAIGCTRAGKAACGAILEVDGGYGRYIGLSVLPSSIVIYGIVIMFSLMRPVELATSAGLFGVGVPVGVAMLFIGVLQGECCAAAINGARAHFLRADSFKRACDLSRSRSAAGIFIRASKVE